MSSFVEYVSDVLDNGFPIEDVDELFAVRELEVTALYVDDRAMFFSELFDYNDDDELPAGLEDYLAEIDFFEPESWDIVVYTESPSEGILDPEHSVYVVLDSFIRNQLVNDLPQFFE